jgi:hypothetical protein
MTMDMYTVFAITMVVTSAIGLVVTWIYLKHAMHEVECGRSVVDRMFQESESERAVRAKIQQTLAERIRILETYRVQHANRLNEQEDILSLLNEEAGRVYEAASVLQPFKVEIVDHPESELFDSSMSDENLHAMIAPTKQRK